MATEPRPTAATTARAKSAWLRKHPEAMQWLAQLPPRPLPEVVTSDVGRAIAASLKVAKVYGPKTIPTDILASMRRAAQREINAIAREERLKSEDLSETSKAMLEVQAILSRPGVNVLEVRAFINRFQKRPGKRVAPAA